jgi:hypothetical protein
MKVHHPFDCAQGRLFAVVELWEISNSYYEEEMFNALFNVPRSA